MHRKTTIYRLGRRAVTPVLLVLGAVLWAGGAVSSQATINCGTKAGIDKEVCVVSGRINSDTTFDTNSYWVLRGAVFVESGATLTLDAGTEVFGEFATNGTLNHRQGRPDPLERHGDGAGRAQQRSADRRARTGRLGRPHHQRQRPAQRAGRHLRGRG